MSVNDLITDLSGRLSSSRLFLTCSFHLRSWQVASEFEREVYMLAPRV